MDYIVKRARVCVPAVIVLLAALLAGCGGESGGFASGLGGGFVNGKLRSVSTLFAPNGAIGGTAHGSFQSGGDIPLVPSIGSTKAYVSIQGAGYQGSDIHFKPVFIRADFPSGFTTTVVTGGTGTSQVLDSVTGLESGMWLQFATTPSSAGLRRIVSVDSGSKTVVLASSIKTTDLQVVTTTANPNYGSYVTLQVPTGKHELDDITDPGEAARLFNMGSTRRIFVEYKDDAGDTLGIATFTILKDPTGQPPPLQLNSRDRLEPQPDGSDPDLTAHEGRIVDLPVDLSNLPKVTTVSPTVHTSDLAKSLVFTAEEQTGGSGLKANKFVEILNLDPSMYLDERSLKTHNVLLADRGFDFNLTVQVRASSDGQGALIGSGEIAIPRLPAQVPTESVVLGPVVGTSLVALSNPFLFTVSQNAPISAVLVDASGNQSTFTYVPDPNNPGLPLSDPTRALIYTFSTDPAGLMGPAVPPTPGKFMATQAGVGNVTMTVAAEADQAGNPNGYFFSTGHVPLQVFSVATGLVISNYLRATVIVAPRTADLSAAGILHLDLALIDQNNVQTVLPQPYNNQLDPFYENNVREVLFATNPAGQPDIFDPDRRPNWLAPGASNADPALATDDSQLRFRAIGVSNNASSDFRDHDCPLTIRYLGFGATGGEVDITVTLRSSGGSGSGGIH